MSKPLNTELYNRVKQMANKVFDSPTGLYRSAWIVKKYKSLGGEYTTKHSKDNVKESNMKRWFKEGWVDLNQPKGDGTYEKCGHPNTQNDKYPLCRPSVKVNSQSPKTYHEISKNRIDEVNKEKQVVKNTGNIRF